MDNTLYTHAGGIVSRLDGNNPDYLIVRSSTDKTHWVFPKGHIEPGESSETTALREVREEAGVKAEILSRLGESEFIKGEENVKVLYFLMRYTGSELSDEDREIMWCSYEETTKKLSFEDARKLLQSMRGPFSWFSYDLNCPRQMNLKLERL